MVNFNDALNTKMSAVERPPLIPIGTYVMQVKAVPTSDKISDGKYETLDFPMQLTAPAEVGDVDMDDLAAYGGLNKGSVIRRRFMFNTEDEAAFKRTLFDVKRFLLDHLQVSGGEDASLKELLDACLGHQCLGYVKWRPDARDSEVMYNEIAKTAPLE